MAAPSAKSSCRASISVPCFAAIVRAYVEESGLKLGQAAQPLRAALTGRAMSPGLFDVMAVLGRDETLARLADQA